MSDMDYMHLVPLFVSVAAGELECHLSHAPLHSQKMGKCRVHSRNPVTVHGTNEHTWLSELTIQWNIGGWLMNTEVSSTLTSWWSLHYFIYWLFICLFKRQIEKRRASFTGSFPWISTRARARSSWRQEPEILSRSPTNVVGSQLLEAQPLPLWVHSISKVALEGRAGNPAQTIRYTQAAWL